MDACAALADNETTVNHINAVRSSLRKNYFYPATLKLKIHKPDIIIYN